MERVRDAFRNRFDMVELDGVRVAFPHGWGLVRASNTRPALTLRFEADSEAGLAEICALLGGKTAEILQDLRV